jgi:hypothetical protein
MICRQDFPAYLARVAPGIVSIGVRLDQIDRIVNESHFGRAVQSSLRKGMSPHQFWNR